MDNDDLICRVTALRQQLDELAARLTAWLHQREHDTLGAATDLHLVGQIYQVHTDIANLQAELGHAPAAQPGTLRDRDLVLSVDVRGGDRDQRSDHQPLAC